jgi:3-oxoacyl-[acyl-carrier protein] reductase
VIKFGIMRVARLTRAKEEGASMQVAGKEVKLGIPGAGKEMEKTVASRVALGRMGSAEEGARAMLMLASPLASYVTGQTLEVNGGSDM